MGSFKNEHCQRITTLRLACNVAVHFTPLKRKTPDAITAPGVMVRAIEKKLLFQTTHCGGVETAVYVHDFAADTRSQVRAKEGARIADFVDGDVTA